MGDSVYIVDYDIPEEPTKNKVRFYRDMKRLREFSEFEYSTLSVVRTSVREVADAVYLLVVAHGGCAHMYRATEIVFQVG
ncbi:MAG: hypothetical protein PVF58_21775 [Candidatus Methanofastidiosia archaeon]|jgi:hypothetical protein